MEKKKMGKMSRKERSRSRRRKSKRRKLRRSQAMKRRASRHGRTKMVVGSNIYLQTKGTLITIPVTIWAKLYFIDTILY